MSPFTDMRLKQIEEAHDPDCDIGEPEVTWVDWALLEMIQDLQNEVEGLRADIATITAENQPQ